MADLKDWIVLDDGIPIGRIYQRHAPANADVAWFWSITTYVEPRSGMRTSGMAETLRREGGLSGQLREMARLGNEGLWPRLTLFSVRAAPGRRGGADEPPKRSSHQINGRQTLHLFRWPSHQREPRRGILEGPVRRMSLSKLIASIEAERRRGSNLSSAIRLFVLDFYRQQLPLRKRPP
jgi:hypothetical protein